MNSRIKAIRKEIKENGKSLSQKEFGSRLGVSRDVIANLERANNPVAPTDQMIKLICREFNVNETWLRTGEGEMFNEMSREEQIAYCFGDVLSEPDDSIKKSLILELVSALAKMDNSDWDAVEDFIIRVYERSHRSPPNNESG